ncbi:uncharacterized protein N7477_007130 [Penicillium maclennaniae]|uniref:uncharacterized protein n=1 Tax=Penicillium maclennaniae TaxID=1343394 RepID=UPI0025407BF3|nr:uncharacterized protein N7477_007130 [Penicillium maclennaniae]KAJ5668560.1 hypothetical protein N7477_007130 [Penicillium maclennaniae]
MSARRLIDILQRHASAHHLHLTSRRFFIGPIPEGWIHGHRKSWYKSRLRYKNYTSHTLSFNANPVSTHYSQLGENQSQDQNQAALSPPTLEEVALTFTHTNEDSGTEPDDTEAELEYEQESSDGPTGELRTLTHPEETQETEPTGIETEAAEQIEDEGPSDHDISDEDSNATPRATSRGQEQVYDNTIGSSSFVTAREFESSSAETDQTSSTIHAPGLQIPNQRPQSQASQAVSFAGQHGQSPLITTNSAAISDTESTTPLFKSKVKEQQKLKNKSSKISGTTRFTLEHQEPQNEDEARQESFEPGRNVPQRLTRKVAKYNAKHMKDKQQRLRSRIAKTGDTIAANRPRRRKLQDGEIVKAERMLVSVQETPKEDLPSDYSENDSFRMDTRNVDKWREYLVVCRKSSAEHAPFALQMYRTRVIPDAQRINNKTRPYYEIQLNHRNTNVNLYSALDKTLVVWHPRIRGTKIYIIRPKSTAHASEWYTFIRQVLGWQRPTKLPINVPDLGISLVFKHPFERLEAHLGATHDDNRHTTLVTRSTADVRYAAKSIIRGCMELLEGRPEWADVLRAWSKTEKMGLAWKRYDRLEWIFGSNEENMYGTMAMESSHELELRPRHHYSTTIKQAGKKEEEPSPVEGFLIRLTSQKGVHQRKNKMFFKRLYFFTQDHYLLFCRPAKAWPPTPPKLIPTGEDESVPTYRQLMDEMPNSWEINPYPILDGDIAWLSSGNPDFVQRHDEEAYAQLQRNVHNTSRADGYIDLCRVKEVRRIQRGSSPADPNISEGPAVDFQPEAADSRRDDGSTKQFDDDRILELELDNGLVVRLQAYDTASRDEWVKRLDALVKYWTIRNADDFHELQAVRQRNLKLLDIDEEMESIVGQFAKKWEVKKAEASPHLHNICSLVGCRTIKMSGHLYRKPRRHATFTRCNVLLTAGQLLVFRSTLRKGNGVQIPHIHQEHETTIDLRDCYIYSGLATESDLLYANQTFDSNNPGLHALPRVYLTSGTYTSRDEDTSITFVIWQPLSKSFFRAQEKGAKGEAKRSLHHVSTLGKHGRTIVFKARSRVEKDRWVLSISSEIDRLQEERQEDIRIVSL